jgi:hypothetical protein
MRSVAPGSVEKLKGGEIPSFARGLPAAETTRPGWRTEPKPAPGSPAADDAVKVALNVPSPTVTAKDLAGLPWAGAGVPQTNAGDVVEACAGDVVEACAGAEVAAGAGAAASKKAKAIRSTCF